MIEDGTNVYAVKSIEDGTVWSYGCGKFCFWIDVFEGPGVLIEDGRAIKLSTDCFPLTVDEAQGLEVKFIEQENL